MAEQAESAGPPGSPAAPVLAAPNKQKFAPVWPRVQWLFVDCLALLFLIPGTSMSGVRWWGRVLAWLGLVVAITLTWRIMRLAVLATAQGLTIRNMRNTHRIPWRDVEEIFTPGPVPVAVYRENPLAAPKWGLFVRLAEGAVISCSAYRQTFNDPGTRSYGRQIREAVSALNALRARYASGPASP